MKAIVITKPGPAEVLEWLKVPDPQCAANEVLINVVASAVNRADLLQRQGFYAPPANASPYPGLECSGVIAAVGADVSGWAKGDHCVALLSGGGYAERVAVPVEQVMRVPRNVSLVSAAALPEVVCTVWSNLVMTARLTPGETLLIHGGSSGIGTIAIQIARALGARVAVTAGSPAKLARCRELGAEILIDYKEQDFVAQLARTTDGRGADVILDNMGAKYLDRNVQTLAPDGRLVVIGLQGGISAELNLGMLLQKRATVSATSLRSRPAEQKAAICSAVVDKVWPLIETGAVQPVIDRILPMSQAAEGHRVLESSNHVGKVVLEV